MSEESTTPDLVELARRAFRGHRRSRDIDGIMSFYRSRRRVRSFGGGAGGVSRAVRRSESFMEDWFGPYDRIADRNSRRWSHLGSGVYLQRGHAEGSSG